MILGILTVAGILALPVALLLLWNHEKPGDKK